MIPQPGQSIGWVVFYGKHHEHQVWCHQDREHAMQVAVRLHGVLVPVVAAIDEHAYGRSCKPPQPLPQA